jgi:predicted O-methyltransferase YrrM
MTDFFHAVEAMDGWLLPAEGKLLNRLAARCARGVIVEIGSWKGKSTCWLAKDSKVPIYAIDPHTGSEEHHRDLGKVATFAEFKRNLSSLGLWNRVTPIVKRSVDATSDVQEPIELLFIDGDHSYEAVKSDFENWFAKVSIGGVVAFHDTIGWEGPQRLMRELASHPQVGSFGRVKSVTWMRKTAAAPPLNAVSNHVRLAVWDMTWHARRAARSVLPESSRSSVSQTP